jgi:hypothetical protein
VSVGQQLFYHSPFTAVSVSEGENPALLLQLIIHELIQEKNHLIETATFDFAPFSWATKPGSKNKVQEHAILLAYAFPNLVAEAKIFQNSLDLTCRELFVSLEPFILACKNNENLLLFLVKQQKSLGIKSILDKICPDGLAKLKKTIASKYEQRGFQISKWTR